MGGGSGGLTHELCTDLASISQDKKVSVDFTLKGRPTSTEKLKSGACKWSINDLTAKCYTVPFPGTGSAGDRCHMYEPDFHDDPSPSIYVDDDITGVSNLDQVNYSCNWNKLAFGSSLTDRITIPLYYQTEDASGNLSIVNPFNSATAAANQAKKFILRFRTPCECGYLDSTGTTIIPAGTLDCSGGVDPTVCIDDKRYDLDDSDNDIVVQWQLNGLCPDSTGALVECGLVPLGGNSVIDEIFVNGYTSTSSSKRIDQTLKGVKTDVDSFDSTRVENQEDLSVWLASAQKPTLTIFLNAALKSKPNDRSVPYLEYQLVTDKPIGNPRNKMEVSVTVDGNNFSKTIYSEERKGLVDFAIQN